MATAPQKMVGMSEIQVAEGDALLVCLGLGSCIGLVVHDPLAKVTGMVHIMLPEAFKDKPLDKPGKFADTGIPELLSQVTKAGADKNKLVFAYAGGAQVFKFGNNGDGRLDVGARNCAAVESILKNMGIRPIAMDVGGSNGRTVTVDTKSGDVKVKSVHTGERVLCNLNSAARRVAA